MDTTGLWPVLIICITNLLAALILLVWSFLQKKYNRSTLLLLSWFILIVPLMGALYLLLGFVIRFLNRKRTVDMSDISFSQERERLIQPPDREVEMNYVPIQDAMAVTDTANLRRLLLDTLRNNARKTVSSIAVAMNSIDTETSHYAASAILDALSEFRSTAQVMIGDMNKYPEDVEMNLFTFDYLTEILNMNIMTTIEQEAYIYTLDQVAENLVKYNLWYMTATHYLLVTNLFISIKDYNMADKWVLRACKYRQGMLDTYKAKLHLLFDQHNQTAFFACLKELKDTDIVVDDEVINLFRLYGS
jgi:hypothetical protein